MTDWNYAKPTTIRDAENNIARIEENQRGLRRRGDDAGAREWDDELRRNKDILGRLKAGREANYQSGLRRIFGRP